MQNHEEWKKTIYDEAETKIVSKNETLKMKSNFKTKETTKKMHKNQSIQAMHGLRTMKKGRKLPLMKKKVK